MDRVWFVAAIWLVPALAAVLAANWLRISTALSEIVVGTVAQLSPYGEPVGYLET